MLLEDLYKYGDEIKRYVTYLQHYYNMKNNNDIIFKSYDMLFQNV
jgi:hypothetical protein